MAETNHPNPAQRLTELRAKIDAVDETIHNLLMQRAGVIDELIRVKGSNQRQGAAFRPGREAQMMQVLAERHSGSVPMVMIRHLWREIISTFTFMQAAYTVHLAETGNGAAMRDTARYQFGFTVPLIAHDSVEATVSAAAADANALAVVPARSPWWQAGDGPGHGLLAMARLPIAPVGFDAADAFVLAPPLADPVPFEVRLYGGRIVRPDALEGWTGGEVIDRSADGKQCLIAIATGGSAPQDLLDIRALGGYFPPSPA